MILMISLMMKNSFSRSPATFFRTYGHRIITFILQHWEGDWMLRREDIRTWDQVLAAEVKRRWDGSKSHAAKYLTTLLEHSVKALPDETRKSFIP